MNAARHAWFSLSAWHSGVFDLLSIWLALYGWWKLHILLNNNVCYTYYTQQLYSMHANDPWYLLWIYFIDYVLDIVSIYDVRIIDQRWMLHMSSIDACYTCHQLCHNSIHVLFLCYKFYVLVCFGLLRYATYVIDQDLW